MGGQDQNTLSILATEIGKKNEIEKAKVVTKFLGTKIAQDRTKRTGRIRNEPMIRAAQTTFGMGQRESSLTPIQENTVLPRRNTDGIRQAEQWPYRELVCILI